LHTPARKAKVRAASVHGRERDLLSKTCIPTKALDKRRSSSTLPSSGKRLNNGQKKKKVRMQDTANLVLKKRTTLSLEEEEGKV